MKRVSKLSDPTAAALPRAARVARNSSLKRAYGTDAPSHGAGLGDANRSSLSRTT